MMANKQCGFRKEFKIKNDQWEGAQLTCYTALCRASISMNCPVL